MNKEWVTDGRMFDWLQRLSEYVQGQPNMHQQPVLKMIERFATIEGLKGNTSDVDVPLVLQVIHSTLVHNLKYSDKPESVGNLNCGILIGVPSMIQRDWNRRGQSDKGFDIEGAFIFYMDKMKMDPAKLHPVQLRETRRAFYGGVSTYLRMLSDSTITNFEDALAQMKDVERQCSEFWASELKGNKG